VVALVIAGLLYFGGVGSKALFSSTACSNITCISGGLRLVADAGGDFESDVAALFGSTVKIGANGTSLNRIDAGTCYIAPYATTIAATTSAAVDCQGTAAWSASGTSALTGIVKGDFVQATLSTTTAGVTYGGIVITGASASTTPGHIQLIIENLTGTTYTWPTSLTATGTASYIASN